MSEQIGRDAQEWWDQMVADLAADGLEVAPAGTTALLDALLEALGDEQWLRIAAQECEGPSYIAPWLRKIAIVMQSPTLSKRASGRSPSYPMIEPNREVLTDRWLALANSWPPDGYPGAGRARAAHAEKVRGVEAMLAELHGIASHGPFEVEATWTPGKSARCICGKRMEPTTDYNPHYITDPRTIAFDRATRAYGYSVPVFASPPDETMAP